MESLIARDLPFNEIEEHIDELPFDEERRSALWLLAWVYRTSRSTPGRVGAGSVAWKD